MNFRFRLVPSKTDDQTMQSAPSCSNLTPETNLSPFPSSSLNPPNATNFTSPPTTSLTPVTTSSHLTFLLRASNAMKTNPMKTNANENRSTVVRPTTFQPTTPQLHISVSSSNGGSKKGRKIERKKDKDKFPLITTFHRLHINSGRIPHFKKRKITPSGGKFCLVMNEPTRQNMTISEIVINNCPAGWENVFKQAWAEISDISQTMERLEATHRQVVAEEERKHGYVEPIRHVPFFPLKRDIFKVFELCPLRNVKVVIFGQDPYHSIDKNYDRRPTAQGMSFSVRKEATVPSSLRNIYKVLTKTIPGFVTPNHGDLTHWVKQGVFLLNTSLTVAPHQANSHRGRWMGLINKVIKGMISFNPNIIYLLWGKEAQKMRKIIGSGGHILETSHPSGLGAKYGFYDSNHFNEVNQRLRELEQTPIDWQIRP